MKLKNISSSICRNLPLIENLDNIRLEIIGSVNWIDVGFMEGTGLKTYTKEYVLECLNKMNKNQLNDLKDIIRKELKIKSDEDIEYEKLYELISKKYKYDDYDISGFVKYDKNYYGIKLYTTDGGYLFDFQGTLNELVDNIVSILDKTNRNFITCPFCSHKTLQKEAILKNECECGVLILQEVSHSDETKSDRLLMLSLGAKVPSEQTGEDYLFFYMKPDDHKYMMSVNKEEFFETKVDEILEKEYDYTPIPNSSSFISKNTPKELEDHIGDILVSIISKIGENLSYSFISSDYSTQYINLKNFKTVLDCIRLNEQESDIDTTILEYKRRNYYYNYSDELSIFTTISEVLNEDAFESIEYNGIKIDLEYCDFDVESFIDDLDLFITDYLKNVSYPDFIKTYIELAEEKIRLISIERDKYFKERERLIEISKQVKDKYFKNLPKHKYTMDKKEKINELVDNIKEVMKKLSDDEIESFKYIDFGRFSNNAQYYFNELMCI